MGLIRVLLAVAVVFSHSYPTEFGGGILAVQLFFIISGFFISYILVEGRNYTSVWAFYENRALRLFPVYWLIALVTLAMYTAGFVLMGNPPPFFEIYQSLDWFGQLALAISNITLFGQDWIMFTGIQDGRLTFLESWRDSETRVWHGLLISPAWSLGVELTFYVIAPFILHRLRLLLLLFVLSLALRFYLMSIGIGLRDPWTYRFFPTELALFIAGALAHQIWTPFLRARGWLTDQTALWVTLLTIALVLVAATLYIWTPYVAVVVVFGFALPFLFHFQRNRSWDRWIGELSYPIYIVHMSVIFPISFLWGRVFGAPGYQGYDETAVILTLTLLASIAIKAWVADPIEVLRTRVRNGRASSKSSMPGIQTK